MCFNLPFCVRKRFCTYTVHRKASFHSQESDTKILAEYIFRLQGRHHQLLLKFVNTVDKLFSFSTRTLDRCGREILALRVSALHFLR